MPQNPIDNAPDDAIEGGRIEGLADLPFHTERHYAETARLLALVLLGVLVGSVVIHYGANIALRVFDYGHVAENTGRIFDVWLPIVSSMASSSVTYYFTRARS